MSNFESDTFHLQKTLQHPIHCEGIGVHSGKPAKLTMHPAETGHGIVFSRSDLPEATAKIEADWQNVSDTQLCTVLSNEHGATISTVEHLMAALWCAGIDNALIEIDGPEIPIMDGSANPFLFLIECAGVKTQPATKSFIRILKEIRIEDGESFVQLTPADEFLIDFTIDFAEAAIGKQQMKLSMNTQSFRRELARARTFGRLQDVEMLRRMGLAQGGDLTNAVVVDGDKVLNPDGLRFENEFVRHKMLDAVGDLYLAGAPILGHFTGHRSGHALNNQLLGALFADSTSWCFTTQSPGDVMSGHSLPARNHATSAQESSAQDLPQAAIA